MLTNPTPVFFCLVKTGQESRFLIPNTNTILLSETLVYFKCLKSIAAMFLRVLIFFFCCLEFFQTVSKYNLTCYYILLELIDVFII